MASINPARKRLIPRTHEGAPAARITSLQQLRRSVLASLLWEKSFYEDGEACPLRMKTLIQGKGISPLEVMDLALEARKEYKLRHAPLWMMSCLAERDSSAPYAKYLGEIIQRPDELTEFLALWWKDCEGRSEKPIPAQIKKGLSLAFRKFDEYQLAKYNRTKKEVKLVDVLNLCHPRPPSEGHAETWERLIKGKLKTPDTWEVALSSGADKKETFERLLMEGRLGALALIRNLRNMVQSRVTPNLIRKGLVEMNTDRILPFRFLAAAQEAPQFEAELEQAMLRGLKAQTQLPGHTVLLVDVSGSMDYDKVSKRSSLSRLDAACGLAILLREVCENVDIYTFSNDCRYIPSRHGMALKDAIIRSQFHAGTYLGRAVGEIFQKHKDDMNRLIILTDEQSHDKLPVPKEQSFMGYVLNVGTYQNGIDYKTYIHIDGWSEASVRYMQEVEKFLK